MKEERIQGENGSKHENIDNPLLCHTFLTAASSPISYQTPDAGGLSFRNRPGGSDRRIAFTTFAAIRFFSCFLVAGER